MKVKLIRNPAAIYNCKLREGETGEVDGDVGKALVDAAIAVSLDEPKPKAVKAVPDKPAIAEAKPAPIKAPKREATPAEETTPKPVEEDPSVVESTSTLKDYVEKQKREPNKKGT